MKLGNINIADVKYGSNQVSKIMKGTELVWQKEEPIKYTVTFVDYDGTILDTQIVYYGGSAIAPTEPSRVGYIFNGWDIDFTNVTSDLTVTATYLAELYIYVALEGGFVNKISKNTLSVISTSNRATSTVYNMMLDGNNLYTDGEARLGGSKSTIKTFNKNTMLYVTEKGTNEIKSWTTGMVQDETKIYVIGNNVNLLYNNKSAGTTSALGGLKGQTLAIDGDYLYTGGTTFTPTSKRIWRINKSTGTYISGGDAPNGYFQTIALDDDYIYVGNSSGTIYKFYKSSLSYVSSSTTNYGGSINSFVIDDTFIYAVGNTTQKIIKYKKSDLSYVDESSSYGGNIKIIVQDDEFLYIGGYTTNKVQKYKKSNLSFVKESQSLDRTINSMVIELNN